MISNKNLQTQVLLSVTVKDQHLPRYPVHENWSKFPSYACHNFVFDHVQALKRKRTLLKD